MLHTKDYTVIAESIEETRKSGISSGYNIKVVTDKFTEILDRKMKLTFPNYNSDKFFKKVYGK